MAAKNPLDGFTVDRAVLRYVGEGLQRPECILAEPDGSLWSADARGGVVNSRKWKLPAAGRHAMLPRERSAMPGP